MVKILRPNKTWYLAKCTVCGVDYETTRVHSRYCGPTCRQKFHRTGQQNFYPQRKLLGVYRNRTLAGQVEQRSSVLDTEPTVYERLQREFERLIPAVDHGDLVERELFLDAEPGEKFDVPTSAAAAVDDNAAMVQPEGHTGDFGGSVRDASKLFQAISHLGIIFPTCRKSYEKARKRVSNLLDSKRPAGDLDRIKRYWDVVKEQYGRYKAKCPPPSPAQQ